MPPTFRSAAGSNNGSAAATTFTPTMPAGFVAGDLLIAVVTGSLGAAPTARPAGWTPLRNIADSTVFNMDIIWKQAAGGDTISGYTATSRKWGASVIAITTGTWNTGAPFDVENGINHTGSASTSHVTPSVTPTNPDTLLIAAFGDQALSTWTCADTNPAMTENSDSVGTGTTPASCATYRSNAAPAASAITRTGTATVSIANAAMWIAAIAPAPPPAGAFWVPRRDPTRGLIVR